MSSYSDSHHLVERLNRLLVIFLHFIIIGPAGRTFNTFNTFPLLIQVAGLSLHMMQERQIPPDALVTLSPSNILRKSDIQAKDKNSLYPSGYCWSNRPSLARLCDHLSVHNQLIRVINCIPINVKTTNLSCVNFNHLLNPCKTHLTENTEAHEMQTGLYCAIFMVQLYAWKFSRKNISS